MSAYHRHLKAAAALRAATTKNEFIRRARLITHESKDVQIDAHALRAYAATIHKPVFIPAWEDYLSDRIVDRGQVTPFKNKNMRLQAAFFEFALNCAVNAGYTYEGPDGVTLKWEKDGSGAAALLTMFDRLRAHHALPGVTQFDPDIARVVMNPHLAATVPAAAFRDERGAVLSEFACGDAARTLTAAFKKAQRGRDRFSFSYQSILAAGGAAPRGFMEDPFRKKLMLLPILFASYAHNQGVKVTLDVPIPADYRVPQTLHNMGVLRLSDELANDIERGRLFDQDDDRVAELRAASVVAVERILNRARTRLAAEDPSFRLEINHIDGDLWFAGRLFDKPMDELDEKKQKIRQGLEQLGTDSSFNQKRYNGRTGKAPNVYTMRF